MGHIQSPNSIYNGMPIYTSSKKDSLILKTIECERLRDFLEFLFDHSEHCDHITYSEAWNEFEEWELKEINLNRK